MVKLEDAAYDETTKANFGMAALNLVMVAVAMALGTFWVMGGALSLITNLVGTFIGLLLGYFILTLVFWVFAKIFGGTGGYMPHYIGLTFVGLWGLLYIIPWVGTYLASLGGLWGIVMNILYVRKLHQISTGKAVAAVLIPYALIIILVVIIMVAVLATMFAGLGMAGGF